MKKLLRQNAVDHRKELDSALWKRESKEICKKILLSKEFTDADIILGYMPKQYEVDITPVLKNALENNKTVLLPRINKDDKLDLHRILDLKDTIKSPLGIDEPYAQAEIFSPFKIELMLIPGVLFDNKGNRLGRGRGYLDKLLVNLNGIKIGVCFDWQINESVPTESHDIPMDMIITNKNIVRLK